MVNVKSSEVKNSLSIAYLLYNVITTRVCSSVCVLIAKEEGESDGVRAK